MGLCFYCRKRGVSDREDCPETPPIDYRALLVKYISHILIWDGNAHVAGHSKPPRFTDAEWAELQEAREEAG